MSMDIPSKIHFLRPKGSSQEPTIPLVDLPLFPLTIKLAISPELPNFLSFTKTNRSVRHIPNEEEEEEARIGVKTVGADLQPFH